MDERDEQQRAAEALATVTVHQDRARRAARVPWWYYAAMFVAIAAVCAANDFVTLTGAKLIALAVLITLVAVLVVRFTGGTAPLSRMRGVQARQTAEPRVLIATLVVAVIAGGLLVRYGPGWGDDLADALGLGDYPSTVTGVLYAAALTALAAGSQAVLRAR
ncbi:hypothetical protein [Actinoplanes sp. N902-109]|uniref:hypothetical protein n=1 Tax=Actinoplanes sp. (strain N902-109) TaxID=649831 RepID=UPI000329540E|nr:hypothetical protein [Actinoplanes sp. N902-109]AGL16916.1 hypothetical protein L083_3406 [Actinoplanes sp. N902-109]